MRIVHGSLMLIVFTCALLHGQQQIDKQRPCEVDSEILRFRAEEAGVPNFVSRGGSFLDKNSAWVGLYSTRDGGRSWGVVLPGPDNVVLAQQDYMQKRDASFADTLFVTPDRGWLNVLDSFWETNNGGLVWRCVLPGPARVYFFDEKYGYLTAGVKGKGRGYTTTDGGKTWRRCQREDVGITDSVIDVWFKSPQLGWAITARRLSDTDERMRVMGIARTDNGGCVWEQLWEAKDNMVKGALRMSYWITDVKFRSETAGWLSTTKPNLLMQTRDGGYTWSARTLPEPEFRPFRIYLEGTSGVWLEGVYPHIKGSGIFHSEDNGATWKELSVEELVQGEEWDGKKNLIPEDWRSVRLLQMVVRSGRPRPQ